MRCADAGVVLRVADQAHEAFGRALGELRGFVAIGTRKRPDGGADQLAQIAIVAVRQGRGDMGRGVIPGPRVVEIHGGEVNERRGRRRWRWRRDDHRRDDHRRTFAVEHRAQGVGFGARLSRGLRQRQLLAGLVVAAQAMQHGGVLRPIGGRAALGWNRGVRLGGGLPFALRGCFSGNQANRRIATSDVRKRIGGGHHGDARRGTIVQAVVQEVSEFEQRFGEANGAIERRELAREFTQMQRGAGVVAHLVGDVDQVAAQVDIVGLGFFSREQVPIGFGERAASTRGGGEFGLRCGQRALAERRGDRGRRHAFGRQVFADVKWYRRRRGVVVGAIATFRWRRGAAQLAGVSRRTIARVAGDVCKRNAIVGIEFEDATMGGNGHVMATEFVPHVGEAIQQLALLLRILGRRCGAGGDGATEQGGKRLEVAAAAMHLFERTERRSVGRLQFERAFQAADGVVELRNAPP